MAVLNVKDTSRLETARFYDGDDKNYHTILNRALEDMEQRDNDLDQIFTPARGARVRARIPNDDQVEIETYIFVDGVTITQTTTVTTLSAVPPTGTSGNERKDLIYLRLDTNAVIRLAGVEAATFAAAVVPDLPTGIPVVPLAALYVDDVPTNFSDQTAIDLGGHIEDLRPAPGTGFPFFEDNSANILADTTVAGLGSTNRVPRSNHTHPLNSDATLPAALQAGNSAVAGVSSLYSHVDHVHALATETSAAVLRTDITGGDVGTALTLPRADHRHPLNVGATIPPVDGGSGTAGVSVVYARDDHQHPLNSSATNPALLGALLPATPGVATTYALSDHRHPISALQTDVLTASWVASGTSRNLAFSFIPDFVIVIGAFAGIEFVDTPGAWIGLVTGVTTERCVGWSVDVAGGENRMGMGARNDRVGYIPTGLTQPLGASADSSVCLFDITAFGSTMTIAPSVSVTGNVYMLAVAQG